MEILSENPPEYHCVILKQKLKEMHAGKRTLHYPTMPYGLSDRDPNQDPKLYFDNYTFLIVVTMYNEDHSLFHKTMTKINENLKRFSTGGVQSEEIAVVVIVDGLEQFLKKLNGSPAEKSYYSKLFSEDELCTYFKIDAHDPKKLDKLIAVNKARKSDEQVREVVKSLMESKLKSSFDSRSKRELKGQQNEIAHCFINSVRFSTDVEYRLKVFFCVKHENKRKLNSHLWFFEGFCKVSNPKFCMLIDVGTEPEEDSLFLLYNAMKKDPQIAGVCGEIIPRLQGDSFFDIFSNAQKVEYKFSHILDKALESLLGYISVLPGAFSAYRWQALMPDDPNGPLWGEYFKSIAKPWLMTCYQSNIYLAEDRVLCLALVSCKGKNNLLKYVKKAIAYTDPPDSFESLLLQRRRWINGSWFALLDSVKNFKKIWSSEHNCCRKLLFTFQMIYYIINIIYSFLLVGIFYLALSICITRQFDSTVVGGKSFVGIVLLAIYVALLVITFLLSIGSDVKKASKTFWAISALFGAYMVLFLVMLINIFFDNFRSFSVWVPVVATIFSFFFILVLNHNLYNVALGCVQFLLATPTYVNTFTIYAICNIHDVSWGNRPENMSSEELSLLEDFEQFRTGWALLWAFLNAFFAYFLEAANASSDSYTNYIYVVGILGMSVLYIRFLGGFIYVFKQKCCKYICIDSGKNQQVRGGSALKLSNEV